MKTILSILFLSLSLVLNAQTRKPIVNGYTLLFDGIYMRVDTVGNRTQMYNHTGKKIFVTVNDGKEFLMKKNTPRTVWSDSFVLTVTRKKITKIYSI